MTWFKVDDNLAFHRKAVAAGNAAMGLWVRAGSWCAQHLTDGFVPEDMVALIGTVAQARRLVKSGLWIEAPGGYLFHQWNEKGRQPTAQSVREARKNSADRQAKWRTENLGNQQVSEACHDVSHDVSNSVSHGVSSGAPTRPDPYISSRVVNSPTQTRTRGGGGEHATAAELNRTAHRPTAHTLVAAWATTQPGLTTARRRELTKAVDALLATGADPELIPATLDAAHDSKWRNPIKAIPLAYEDVRRGATTSTTQAAPADPHAQLADIRDRLDVSAAARLVGVAWIEPAQHPDDETPFSDWYRTQREAFIDQHATQIITAITERARRAG